MLFNIHVSGPLYGSTLELIFLSGSHESTAKRGFYASFTLTNNQNEPDPPCIGNHSETVLPISVGTNPSAQRIVDIPMVYTGACAESCLHGALCDENGEPTCHCYQSGEGTRPI